MKFLALLITSYLAAGVLDLLSKRNRSTTKSLNKFTVRTIMDVAYMCNRRCNVDSFHCIHTPVRT